jgi:hypothetical protein
VARRSPQQARALGLWTAACLFVLLLAGVLWVGEISLQWPVLVVPVVWALVAVRPRGARTAVRGDNEPPRGGEHPFPPLAGERPYPQTRELPWLPDVPRDDRRTG